MRPTAHDNQLTTTTATAVCCFLLAASACAQDYDAEFLNQMRSKRFFALAEKYCEDEIESEESSSRRTQLVMELSRTLVEHGKTMPPQDREALWKQAEQALFDGAGLIPEQHLKTRLEVQNAINVANEATFLRWQSEVTPSDSYLRQIATDQIQKAKTAIRAARNRAKSTLGEAPYNRSDLRNALDLHAALTTMDAARLEEPNSAERISLASKAEEIARRLSSAAVNNANRLEARLLYAACCRERGDGAKAISVLDSATKVAKTRADRSRIFAERMRTLLYEQRPDEAMKQIIKWRQDNGSLIGELHYLRMQTLTELLKIAENAKDSALATELLSQMQSSANYAKQEVGGYWSFRCEQLFRRTKEANELGSELTKLKRQAERDFTAGNLPQAATNFGLAAKEAVKRNRKDTALQLYYQQGSLLVRTEQFEPAATAFREAAVVNGSEPGRDAHLMSAWCLGRLYQQKRTKARREAYTAALVEHRNIYKSGNSHTEATFMLAQHEEARLQNTKAIELYRQIPATHTARYQAASAGIARCYSKVITRLKSLKNEKLTSEWLTRSAKDLAPRIAQVPPEPTRLKEPQIELIIYAAAVILQQSEPETTRAAELLQRGKRNLEDTKPTARTEQLARVIEKWEATTAIASGNTASVMQKLGDPDSRSADELMSIIASINKTSVGNPQAKLQSAELRLRVGEAALRKAKDLSAKKRLELRTWMVRTYLDHGKSSEALTQATSVINSTRDRATLSKVAAEIQTIRGKDGQTLARKGWKKLETSSQAGSAEWLNARLHVAECTFALGQAKECRKLIELTRLLYPELGNSQIKSAFIRLEAQLP